MIPWSNTNKGQTDSNKSIREVILEEYKWYNSNIYMFLPSNFIITFLWTGKTSVLIVTPLVTLWVSKYFLSHFLIVFTCSELLVLRKISFVPHRHGVFAWNVWPPKTMQRLTGQRTKCGVYSRTRNWTQVSLRYITLGRSTATILILNCSLLIMLV